MKIFPLFNGDKDKRPERSEEVSRISEELKSLGGVLVFAVEKGVDGWSAQCKQVPGIITGGSNPEPTEYEIQSQVRDAIYSAFHIETRIHPELLKTSITEFSLSL